MARRQHPGYAPSYSDPVTNIAAVTPSDTVDLVSVTRALLVGTAGNVKVTMLGGQTVTIPVAQGWNPVCVTRIWATNTTASNIFAAW